MKAGDRYVMPCGTQIELMRFSESIQCWKCGRVNPRSGRVYAGHQGKRGGEYRGARISVSSRDLHSYRPSLKANPENKEASHENNERPLQSSVEMR